MKQIFAFLFLTLATVLPAEAACLSQAEARQAVASGQAKSLGSVVGQVMDGEIIKKKDILKAELCRQGGGFVYILSVLKNGKVTNVTVNASR